MNYTAMNYQRQPIACLFVGIVFIFQANAAAQNQPFATVTVDREAAIYKCGDQAQFTITLTDPDSIPDDSIIAVRLDDFLNPVSSEDTPSEFKLGDAKSKVIKLTSDAPKFIRCIVSLRRPGTRPVNVTAAVAFSPEKIEPSMPVPEDFAEFWSQQKAALAKIKPEPKLDPIEQSNSSLQLFDIKVACVDDIPVSGYFAKPVDAKEKSLPALLWVHGAGVRTSVKSNAINGAKAGFLSLDINAHGIENGKPAEYYNQLNGSRLRGYRHQGRTDRESLYFRGMYLRLVRAIDFLTAQPEWDGKHVIVVGHSQGGGQALAAGGLDDRVTFIAAGVPALCDHSGLVAKRVNGWPKIVPTDSTGKPDPEILQAARYYDAVNFASLCKADAIMSVGFIDAVCPPSSCYAAYNQLAGDKHMINRPVMGHAAPADIQNEFFQAILQHVKKD